MSSNVHELVAPTWSATPRACQTEVDVGPWIVAALSSAWLASGCVFSFGGAVMRLTIMLSAVSMYSRAMDAYPIFFIRCCTCDMLGPSPSNREPAVVGGIVHPPGIVVAAAVLLA